MSTQQQQQQQGGSGTTAKRKPVFTKVDQLKPGTSGHTLTAMVVSSKTVLQKGRAASPHLRQTRIAECLIGDETGTILFTARNDQAAKEGIIRLPETFGIANTSSTRWLPYLHSMSRSSKKKLHVLNYLYDLCSSTFGSSLVHAYTINMISIAFMASTTTTFVWFNKHTYSTSPFDPIGRSTE